MVTSVLELGTWRLRHGTAGDDSAVLSPPGGVIGADGRVLVDGVVELVTKAGASALLIVERGHWLEQDARMEVLGGLMEGTKALEGVYFVRGAVAATFAVGRTTGLVLDVGEEGIVASAVVEGHLSQKSIQTDPNAGAELSQRLAPLLVDGGAHVDDVKPQLFTTAPGPSLESVPYRLPDGTTLSVPTEKVTALADTVAYPLAILTQRAAVAGAADLDPRRVDPRRGPAISDVILTGGSSLVYSVPEAVTRNAEEDTMRAVIAEGRDRLVQSWRGGSILASLPLFSQLAISRADYTEQGSSIIATRCP